MLGMRLDAGIETGYHCDMSTDVAGRIRRIYLLIILAFLAVIGWQSTWHLARADWLERQVSNPRTARQERDTPRGAIRDCNGQALAWTENGLRRYADSTAMASVIGYLDPEYGRSGVEGMWNAELAGLVRRFTPAEWDRLQRNEPRHGKDIVLTLDLGLQQAAMKALGERKGAVVALDPATGAIRALATYPTFDLLHLKDAFTAARADTTSGALRNRAVQDFYPPGSTMKVVTASAALMHGVLPSATYACPGTSRIFNVTVSDYHGERHGTIAMSTALADSCNNYFARTAGNLGAKPFTDTAEAFGFDKRWWQKLPDPRMLPLSVAWSTLTPQAGDIPSLGELAHMGFGQSTVVASPLQMAMVAAGVANDGTVMSPYLVSGVRDSATGPWDTQFASTPVGMPLDKQTAATVADMMRGVVTHGTARGADVPGLTVYGKTGTAEQEGGNDHAWFIGFAERNDRTTTSEAAVPVSKPRLAFAVIIERGGTGGRVAMPVARDVLKQWAEGRSRQ
jgi:penicillin-binding protein A